MAANTSFPHPSADRDSMPLDTARTAFHWLVAGPNPAAVDGRLFAGLPARPVPLDELRDHLLQRDCPQALRDAVWTHLVLLARTEGGAWTIAATGVALPALTTIAAKLSSRFVGDPSDIHAAVLTGFLAELEHVDLRKPRIMLRLRWAAYRAGHTALREALDAPVPAGAGFRSAVPHMPWGHPDFVLARAVAEGVVTSDEAELVGSTRLEGLPLATAGEQRGLSYEAVKKMRWRAEQRLVAYIRDGEQGEHHTDPAERDLADQVADAAVIADASTRRTSSPAVTGLNRRAEGKAGGRLSHQDRDSGVQGCGRTAANPASPSSSERPAAPSDTTPEVPRCA